MAAAAHTQGLQNPFTSMTRASAFPTPTQLRGAASARSLIACGALALLTAAPACAQEAPLLTPFTAASGTQAPAPWHFSSLPNKTPTRFEVVQQDGRRVLKVDADQSYGNLVHRLQAPLTSATTLAWRWRVGQFVEGADLRTRAGDDGAARICVFFDLPTQRLPLVERTRLALARSAVGEDVPSEALCYVWDATQPKGSSLVNAYTRRMRMVVLESGPTPAGGAGWVTERRNLLEDYQRAFGDEAGGLVPDIAAVVISADADNTHGHGVAYFSDVALKSPPLTPPAGTAE